MSSLPPRFVPTLTEVVRPETLTSEPPSGLVAAGVDRAASEEQLVLRVLQRVDLVLERRLREAVGALILEHTKALAPQLREEIVAVVRQSVSQAFAQEASTLPPRP